MTVLGTESSREPGREPKVVFLNVRFQRSMHAKLAALAERHERTLAAEIRTAVKRHIEAEELVA